MVCVAAGITLPAAVLYGHIMRSYSTSISGAATNAQRARRQLASTGPTAVAAGTAILPSSDLETARSPLCELPLRVAISNPVCLAQDVPHQDARTHRTSLQVFSLKAGRVRDPAVLRTADGYLLFFTRYRGDPARMFTGSASYTVSVVATTDWLTFSDPVDVTPEGYCSPDAPVHWRSRLLIAYQALHIIHTHTLPSVASLGTASPSNLTYPTEQAYPDKALGGKKSGLYFSSRRVVPCQLTGPVSSKNARQGG